MSRRVAALMATLCLAACGSAPERPAARTAPVVVTPAQVPAPAPPRPPLESGAFKPGRDYGPSPEEIPPGLADLPDPVPTAEPRSSHGNPKSYEVFGKRYQVMSDAEAEGFREIGIASWYGKKFHGRRTSSGEAYDMYALSGAHKTLPLPSYVRVTHLKNGKSVVVRINDRGPFHDGRIIDLSYAAATRIGLTGGTGQVEIEAITPGKALPPPPQATTQQRPPAAAARYLQAGAFSDPIGAIALREELARVAATGIEIRSGTLDGLPVHRVLLGPYADTAALQLERQRLLEAGIDADPLSSDQ